MWQKKLLYVSRGVTINVKVKHYPLLQVAIILIIFSTSTWTEYENFETFFVHIFWIHLHAPLQSISSNAPTKIPIYFCCLSIFACLVDRLLHAHITCTELLCTRCLIFLQCSIYKLKLKCAEWNAIFVWLIK